MTGPDASSPAPEAAPEAVAPGGARRALDRAILGEDPSLTAAEVAERAGLALTDAERLWRALGFPDSSGEVAFTGADATALGQIRAAVDAGLLDLDTIVRMTRAVGRTVARLAEWEVGTLTADLDPAVTDPEAAIARVRRATDLVQRIGPSFDQLLVYSWRRHLAAAVGRDERLGVGDQDQHLADATVGFADLVGFSALTNLLDDEQIGDLVEMFETRSADVVSGRHGRLIKTLGDSVLFVAGDPPEAIDIALDVVAVIGQDARLPDVRVGLATGPVVFRMGDVYGPTVNLASRLTTVARRNRVIIDHRTADLLPEDRFKTRALPARPVRGFGDVEPVTVRRTR